MDNLQRLVIMDVLYRNTNQVKFEDFRKAILLEGYDVGLPELTELRNAGDVSFVNGKWQAERYNELFDKTWTYVGPRAQPLSAEEQIRKFLG
jgi:hypothetical protein